MMKQIDPAKRFWAKVQITDGCWLWTGPPINTGYGRISVGGRSGRDVLVHRYAYELMVGSIPSGMEIDHICHNLDLLCREGKKCPHRRCVNPAHLKIATHSDNTLAGRSLFAERARASHCSKGHPLEPSPEKNRIRRRRCYACHKERARQRTT